MPYRPGRGSSPQNWWCSAPGLPACGWHCTTAFRALPQSFQDVDELDCSRDDDARSVSSFYVRVSVKLHVRNEEVLMYLWLGCIAGGWQDALHGDVVLSRVSSMISRKKQRADVHLSDFLRTQPVASKFGRNSTIFICIFISVWLAFSVFTEGDIASNFFGAGCCFTFTSNSIGEQPNNRGRSTKS